MNQKQTNLNNSPIIASKPNKWHRRNKPLMYSVMVAIALFGSYATYYAFNTLTPKASGCVAEDFPKDSMSHCVQYAQEMLNGIETDSDKEPLVIDGRFNAETTDRINLILLGQNLPPTENIDTTVWSTVCDAVAERYSLNHDGILPEKLVVAYEAYTKADCASLNRQEEEVNSNDSPETEAESDNLASDSASQAETLAEDQSGPESTIDIDTDTEDGENINDGDEYVDEEGEEGIDDGDEYIDEDDGEDHTGTSTNKPSINADNSLKTNNSQRSHIIDAFIKFINSLFKL